MCVLTCYLSPACVPESAASLGSERPAVCSSAHRLYRDSPLEGDKNTVRVTDAAESELVSVFSSLTDRTGLMRPLFSECCDCALPLPETRLPVPAQPTGVRLNSRVVSGCSLQFLLKDRAAVKETRVSLPGGLKAELKTYRHTPV